MRRDGDVLQADRCSRRRGLGAAEFSTLAPDGGRRWFGSGSAPFYNGGGKIAGAVLVTRETTQLTRAREQLGYLLPMLDHTEDAIVAMDPDWRITAWNKGAERMYGWTAQAVLGRRLPSFVRMDRSHEERDERRFALARDGRLRADVEVERKDASRISVETITVAIRNDSGEITGYLGIHRDITERRRAEDALREAQGRTQTILESISDEFFAVDREWRYIYVNQRTLAKAAQIPGVRTAADLLGKNIWKQFPQLIGTPFDREARRAMRERTAVELETSSPVTKRWIHAHMYPSDAGLSVYLRDTTARKQAEDRLRYHASLLDNVEDGVIATDAEDFRITAWNRGAERLYGYSAGAVLGRPAREVASYPGDQARVKLEREVQESDRTRIEFAARHKDGTAIDVELIAAAVRDEHGEITGYLGIHRDVTERARAERALERRVQQQAAVAELGVRALEDGALQPLMEEAVTLVSRTLGVEFAKVDELLPDGEALLVTAGVGWSEGVVGSCVMPAGLGSPAGYALLVGEPVIVDDMSVETRFEVPALLREHDVMSYIAVVVAPRGASFGTLAAASRSRRGFCEDDVSFVQSVANVLAAALERGRTDERVEAVREAERRRIARELHDAGLRELTEALGVATIGRSNATAAPDEQRWAAVTASLRRLGQQLRSAIYELRLETHEERAFVDLLDELVGIQDGLFGARAIELYGRRLLPSGSLGRPGAEVLRIVREAITNARRHSGAAVVQVDASASTPTELRIDVSDDGAWSDREAAVSGRRGMGLVGMRERADEIGAELRIRGRREGGTRVSLVLPLSRGS